MAFTAIMLLLIIASALFWTFVDACAVNGVCSGAPYCKPPYQRPISCQCSLGYQCGMYGCYRPQGMQSPPGVFEADNGGGGGGGGSGMGGGGGSGMGGSGMGGGAAWRPQPRSRSRSRMSQTELLDKLLDEEERALGLQPIDQSSLAETMSGNVQTGAALSSSAPTSRPPNRPSQRPQAGLQRMYFKQDACPMEAARELQFCAAQGRDHRACCARSGVAATAAGVKCLIFCDQRPGKITQLDLSYVGCYDRFASMKSCFWHDITRNTML